MSSTASLPPASPPAPHPFTFRLVLGLIGVLIAALTSGLNDRVSDIALADLRAATGIDYATGSWLISAYQAAEVAAMMLAPWFAVTLSLRRFTLAVSLGFALTGALLPFAHSGFALIALRVTQGIFGGALPPMLMTVALRFLPPPYKLFGLSGYALTATFGPNMAASLATLWTDMVGWQFVFWQVIPPMLIACLLIGFGIPQDPLRLERFRQIDLLGMVTGSAGVAMMVLALTQGERLDWFESPLYSALFLASLACLTVFLINEWFHPLPLFKLQMLSRRNLAFGLLALAAVLTLALSGSALPAGYLAQVSAFRTAQFAPLALTIGLPQLVIAPLVAALLNIRWIDCRWVLVSGAALIAASCLLGAQITSDWARTNFWLIQIMQALGQPMIILPILMTSTSVVAPPEGPFASAMFNTVRGFSSVAASTLVEWFLSHREKFHSNVLLDTAAQKSWLLTGNSGSAPLLADGSASSSENLSQFATLVKQQATVLGISDSYLMLTGFAMLLILMAALLPQRVWPPQTLLQPATTKTRT